MFLTKEKIDLLDHARLPRHVAIIPDGNRRWAQRNFCRARQAYSRGMEAMMNIIEFSAPLSIEVLTFYLFSTENQERKSSEKQLLMSLLEKALIDQRKRLLSLGVRLMAIGDLEGLPKRVQERLQELIELSSSNQGLKVVLALNYGGRDELVRAFRRIQKQMEESPQPVVITEKLVSINLDTAGIMDPDLFIRTSGEQRLSNFLLWQGSYSEHYVAQNYWPDFSTDCFVEALLHFQTRTRRLGR